jgi:CRP-like cAMP-binding protein
MSFKLKELVFKVRCRAPGCAFFNEVTVKENIMGATEADIDSEAIKIARDMAYLKHDATFGRTHALENPDITKISGSYEQLGTPAAHPVPPAPHVMPAPVSPAASAPTVPTRTYKPGETIIKKGESAGTVCEVVKGLALNEMLPDLLYKPGTAFGSSAIFRNKNRMADVVAGPEGATIAFYDLKELMKNDPVKARQLYEESLEDLFQIVRHLEDYGRLLEKRVHTLETSKKAARPVAKKTPAKKAPAKKAPVKKTAKKAAKKIAPKKTKRAPTRKPTSKKKR